MSYAPAGWTQHHGVHLVSLIPPQGGARIRIYERLRPVLRVSRVIDYVLAKDPLFRTSAIHDTQTLTTDEGEYGAWVRLTGTRDGARCSRVIGAVFADEYTFVVDGFVLLAEQTALVIAQARKLLLSTPLRLGVRRRRFLYEPPQGWRAVPSGLVANWYPPDYPKARVNLVVAPAEPSAVSVHEIADVAAQLAAERERGFVLEGEVESEDVLSLSGLTGRRCAYTVSNAQGQRRVELAAYATAPYVYVMRMEAIGPSDRGSPGSEANAEGRRGWIADAEAHHRVFLDCARSVAPLPLAGQGRVGVNTLASEPLAHWVD